MDDFATWLEQTIDARKLELTAGSHQSNSGVGSVRANRLEAGEAGP